MLAKIDYLFSKGGENFNAWLLHHLTEREHYVFKGDDYFMMGWYQWPQGRDGEPDEPYWVVYFAYTAGRVRLDTLLRLMPYPLNYVAFCRGLRGKKDLKYYSVERLRKLCEISG